MGFPLVLFLLGQILAERRQRRKLFAGGFHISPLADQIVGDRAAQPRIGDVMGGMGGDRQVAAGELVPALRTGLDTLEPAVRSLPVSQWTVMPGASASRRSRLMVLRLRADSASRKASNVM